VRLGKGVTTATRSFDRAGCACRQLGRRRARGPVVSEPRDDAQDARPLAPLGISEAEELTYRTLLGHPDATARDLAAAIGMSPRKTQRLLDVLEAKGL